MNKTAKIALICGAAGLAVVGLIGLGLVSFCKALENFELLEFDNELIDEDTYKK